MRFTQTLGSRALKKTSFIQWSIVAIRSIEAMVALVKTSIGLRYLTQRPASKSVPNDDGPVIFVVLPLLHESAGVSAALEHWRVACSAFPRLSLALVTTERENIENPNGENSTAAVILNDENFKALYKSGQVRLLHCPRFSKTYREQLAFGLDELGALASDSDYFYVTNVDSRLSTDGMADVLALADNQVEFAQQSALFLGNFDSLKALPAAEALLQSRWTVETEIFRYLAGSGGLPFLPQWLSRAWYQHAVGHGLLMNVGALKAIGGLPEPAVGLEDSAIGFEVRSSGFAIAPMRSIEIGEAPTSVGALLRQRAVWVRGPLGALSYPKGTRRRRVLAAQSIYDGVKWATSLPFHIIELKLLRKRFRLVWAIIYLGRHYAPLLGLIVCLPRLNGPTFKSPSTARLRAAIALYWAAPVTFGLGGFVGALRLTRDVIGHNEFVQSKTEQSKE